MDAFAVKEKLPYPVWAGETEWHHPNQDGRLLSSAGGLGNAPWPRDTPVSQAVDIQVDTPNRGNTTALISSHTTTIAPKINRSLIVGISHLFSAALDFIALSRLLIAAERE